MEAMQIHSILSHKHLVLIKSIYTRILASYMSCIKGIYGVYAGMLAVCIGRTLAVHVNDVLHGIIRPLLSIGCKVPYALRHSVSM